MRSQNQMLIRNCRHMMPTGATCQSPATRDSAYCYYHLRLHSHHPRPLKPKDLPKLEKLDSPHGIHVAITQVLNGLLARKIDPRQAGRALYGIQIASQAVEGAMAARLASLAERIHPKPSSPAQEPCLKSRASAKKPADSSSAATAFC